jgi:hypothetical protein
MTSAHTTRLLIVVFLALLGVVALVQLNRPADTPAPTVLPMLFPGIGPTQITRIELENHMTGQKLTLVKVPGDWTGTDEKGRPVPVDLNRVTRIIQILPTLRYNRMMEGSDVKAFGLADGGLFVVRFDAGGSTYTLHVGDLNSALTYAYVQRGDDGPIGQILATDANTLTTLVRTADSSAP